MSSGKFDIIIIGGGHAGAEAAHAAARLGADTALVTMSAGAIGRMSCNPAIGGLGKGQMVREIDALGGLMGQAIDATGIQFRMLNTSKGPAVQAPRAQADRQAYADWVRQALEATVGLTIVEGVGEQITAESGNRQVPRRVTGVRLADGRQLTAASVVITTGTFMRALMHCGARQTAGGRVDEPSAAGISASLESLGLRLGRLKTGTPPRIHRDSIDYAELTPQPGDAAPRPFSFLADRIDRRQIDCWITYTNQATHALIRDNLHQAPMYSGQIQSPGPRYCPSIEDKVVRFADKTRHQLFLEPEGYDDERVYCNGISTSLPAEVQHDLVRSIKGLERADILQPGYAVEYDYVSTEQIQASLETKAVARLFLAGQVNGTSGYEEAAGQGLLAGVNAVRRIGGQEPIILGRDQAYLGVMIDDLITRPPSEPYRMFTSRAEYRLQLRADNADQRLTPLGRAWGLVQHCRWNRFCAKQRQMERIRSSLPDLDHQGVPMEQWLRRPEARASDLELALSTARSDRFDRQALEQVHIQLRYGGYLERQDRQIQRFRELEDKRLPAGLNYSAMSSLRLEAREHLGRVGPRTVGQAARIPGISQADLTVLLVHLRGLSA
ncbi:MAG: tRNA uridine-5-carboxymethylaminomethyl(34) synthesis enzyme MnmG [Phycisphaerae bacterium]